MASIKLRLIHATQRQNPSRSLLSPPPLPHSDTFHGAEISTASLQYYLYCIFLLFLLSSWDICEEVT